MKAMRFTARGTKLELCNIPIPVPKSDEVLLKVLACGICAGDEICKNGFFGTQYPKTPGHEIVGLVEEIGSDVIDFKKGDYAGTGWFGSPCARCGDCCGGQPVRCKNAKVTGVILDGGYAEYVIIKRVALVRVKKEFATPNEVAPLFCAGVTTFNALRNSGAGPGDLVVIHGIGGLGHLGIQFARKMGFHTIAVSRGTSKKEWSLKLGAHDYFDSEASDTIQKIQELGGAKVILSTVTDNKAVENLIPALGYDGTFVLVGALHHPVSLQTLPMLGKRQRFLAWPGGNPKDVEDCIKFCVLQDIKSVVETFPLEKAQEAFERLESNKAIFRVVLSNSQ